MMIDIAINTMTGGLAGAAFAALFGKFTDKQALASWVAATGTHTAIGVLYRPRSCQTWWMNIPDAEPVAPASRQKKAQGLRAWAF